MSRNRKAADIVRLRHSACERHLGREKSNKTVNDAHTDAAHVSATEATRLDRTYCEVSAIVEESQRRESFSAHSRLANASSARFRQVLLLLALPLLLREIQNHTRAAERRYCGEQERPQQCCALLLFPITPSSRALPRRRLRRPAPPRRPTAAGTAPAPTAAMILKQEPTGRREARNAAEKQNSAGACEGARRSEEKKSGQERKSRNTSRSSRRRERKRRRRALPYYERVPAVSVLLRW